MIAHPLDRPILSALTGRQAALAGGSKRALRFPADQAYFAAARDASPEARAALAALIPEDGEIWLLEPRIADDVPGTRIVRSAWCRQMVMAAVTPGADVPAIPLDDGVAAAMHALATLTEPGPFLPATHRFGDFIGVKEDGRLIAMAGTRLRPGGYTEVSGVCTHPDARGRGLASALTRMVARRLLARGETPFLHSYADHAATIALYATLGFASHADIMLTVLARD